MSFAAERHAREERRALIAKTEPIIQKLERGQRLSNAERSNLDGVHAEIARLNEEIASYSEARQASVEAGREMGYTGLPAGADETPEARAFTNYLRTGVRSPELRAAGEASGSAGGYLVPPGWWQRLQVAVKAYGGTAADFQFLPTDTGQPMNWATNDPTNVVGVLVAENAQINNQDYTFGQGTLGAYMFSSQVQLVSIQLAQDTAFDIDEYVQTRSGEALGRALAQYSISGTGTAQPLGIITALAATSAQSSGGKMALGVGQQVNVLSSTPATAGTATVSELVGNVLAPSTVLRMIEGIDPAYRNLGAKFYMNDKQLNGMRGIVDGFGRPFYASLQGAMPDLYGYPVVVDNNIPNLTVNTTGGPIFGHLPSAMVLRSVKGAGLMRLEERYADFLQVGYIGYHRWDIRSNDLRAAITVTVGAS